MTYCGRCRHDHEGFPCDVVFIGKGLPDVACGCEKHVTKDEEIERLVSMYKALLKTLHITPNYSVFWDHGNNCLRVETDPTSSSNEGI